MGFIEVWIATEQYSTSGNILVFGSVRTAENIDNAPVKSRNRMARSQLWVEKNRGSVGMGTD